MLGYILLGFAIYYYFYAGMKKWSVLLFLFFCTNGFQLIPNTVIGSKHTDLAAIYCLFVATFSMIYEDSPERENKKLKTLVVILMYFMLSSILFSRWHYDLSWFQVLQGGRRLFVFVSYFFLVKLKKNDIMWLLNKCYYLTLITSILYIIQVLTDLPVLPYREIVIDPGTGLTRYHNSPPMLYLFLYLTIFYPELINIKRPHLISLVFLSALLCTQGRIEIFSGIFMMLIGFLMRGRLSVFGKYAVIFAIALIPVYSSISGRIEGNETSGMSTKEELQGIINGSFKESAISGKFKGEGTFNYRLAWIYERMLYLSQRPIGEKIYGLGMISESQTQIIQQRYNFKLGMLLENGEVCQLSTPDIAYGNFLTQYGYVGGLLFLMIWIYIMIFGWKNRKKDEWMFILFLLIAGYLIRSFSGDYIANPRNLFTSYLLITLFYYRQKEKEQLESTDNIEEDTISSEQSEKVALPAESQ